MILTRIRDMDQTSDPNIPEGNSPISSKTTGLDQVSPHRWKLIVKYSMGVEKLALDPIVSNLY